MMLSHSFTLPCLLPTPHQPARWGGVGQNLQVGRRRGISVITCAGPSTTSYIFAFVFPLSLLAVTVLTSIRIADKLDQKFLEEQAINEAILEAEEEENDELPISPEEELEPDPEPEPAPVRRPNRPKRPVESSSL